MSKQYDYISCIILFANSECPLTTQRKEKEFSPVIDMLFVCY